MATRRNSPSRIDSSRLLCTLRMYQSILSDFGFLGRLGRLFGGRRFGDRRSAVGRGGVGAPPAASADRLRRLPAARRLGLRRPASAAADGVSAAGARRDAADSASPALRFRRQLRGRLLVRHVQVVHHARVPRGCPIPTKQQLPKDVESGQDEPPRQKIMISTTIEARNNSVRVGQDTLFISASTAIRKSANAGHVDQPVRRPTGPTSKQHAAAGRYCHAEPLPASIVLSRNRPSAIATASAAKVTCRVMRPWLRL